ncbi:MAG: pantetheine-phosphate adenylyltransferase [Candidatus Hodarchaeota archaeon]
MNLAVGGTFDRLHEGHELLFEAAFAVGSFVQIGVLSDELIQKSSKELKNKIASFEERKSNVEAFIKRKGYIKPYRIRKLTHPYGITHTDPDLEAIVVSEETLPTVFKINEIRVQKRFEPLVSIVIPEVRDEFGTRISSTKRRKIEP